MTKNANFVSHKKSKQKNQDGSPKLPLASALVEGEIAINFGKDVETLSIKNESGDVVTFSSDNYYTEQKLGSGFTSANSAVTVTDVIEENEEIISAALTDLDERKLDASAYTPTDLSNYYTRSETSGATEISNALGGKVNSATFTGHTADTAMHFTTTEKTNLDSLATNIAAISGITSTKVSNWDGAATNSHTHSNKAYLDGITSSVGTMAYQDASSYSSATQVNAALEGKVNTSDVISAITPPNSGSTAPIATSVVAENELVMSNALIDLDERKLDATAYTDTDKLIHDTLARRTRKTSFSLSDLKNAVADQSLEKYGLKVGDETTINGYRYVIAGLNTMKGVNEPYRVNSNHVGLIVIPGATHAWNVSGNTYESEYTHSSSDGSWTLGAAAGYANCDLHYYLTHTILDHVKADLSGGTANGVLYQHKKLLSNSVNTSGYNRFGTAGGCTNSWAWYDEYISALSEIQVYGSTVWSSSGYDTGEACRQLDVFRVYNMNEIFGREYPWLRDVASSSYACGVDNDGRADYHTASNARYVAALILFG